MTFSFKPLAVLTIFGAAALCGPAIAQDNAGASASFSLQLNNATPTDGGGCQLAFVARNNSANDLSEVSFQFALFDANGGLRDKRVFPFGELIGGKTRVVQYVLDQTACDNISQILVNNVESCKTADGGDSNLCSRSLDLSSRLDINFIY